MTDLDQSQPSPADLSQADLPETDLPEHEVPQTEIPQTGIDDIDAALAELDGLEQEPVSEHHDRLARVHEALHQALHRPSDDGSSPS